MIVEKDAFNAALAPADKLARKGRDIPILSHVLLAVREGRLTLRGSTLDEEVAATMAKGFSGEPVEDFTCPAQQLAEFAKNAPGTEIEIRLESPGNRVETAVFLSGRARLRLPVLPASDFPQIAARDLAHSFTCDGRTLARALKATAFAASTEETRAYLCGVHIHPDGDDLVLAATDGHRLVRQVVAAISFDEGDIADLPRVILPTGMVDRLLPVIDREEDVTVSLSDSAVRVRISGTSVLSKLVDGIFPDYGRVIPRFDAGAPLLTATFDVSAMAAAVKRVMAVADDKSKTVRFTFGQGVLELRASAEGGLESIDEIAIDCACEAPVAIGFNGRYMLDMLAHCGGDRLEMRTNGPGDPALFRIPGEERNLAILMPLRV